MRPGIIEDIQGNFTTPFTEKVKEYVAGFIGEHFSEKICYHNIDHTLEVVNASELIAKQCNVSDKDLETVIIAAWFHDTGYYLGCENHEEASASIAEDYLKKEKVTGKRIQIIAGCILSTKLPQKPENILEKVLCDADLFHLSTPYYFEKADLLLRELSFQVDDLTRENWLKMSREFIIAHQFHTSYGKKVLYPLLRKNLRLLNQRIDQIEAG